MVVFAFLGKSFCRKGDVRDYFVFKSISCLKFLWLVSGKFPVYKCTITIYNSIDCRWLYWYGFLTKLNLMTDKTISEECHVGHVAQLFYLLTLSRCFGPKTIFYRVQVSPGSASLRLVSHSSQMTILVKRTIFSTQFCPEIVLPLPQYCPPTVQVWLSEKILDPH